MAAKRESVKLAIIGAGMYAAAAHMPALHKLRNAKVVAVCRTHKEKLEKFQQMFQIPRGYTQFRRLLAKEKNLDGVIISSPNSLHFEHSKACLEKGLPLLIEKPMAVKLSEGKELLQLVKRKKLPVVVGYNRHFWANFCYAKKMIEEEELGSIYHISARWVADIEWALARREPPDFLRAKAFYKDGDPPNFRGDPKLAGGGMLIDSGSNLIDAILWLTDYRPKTVYAVTNNRGFPLDCDASLTLEFREGAQASCTLLGATKSFKGHELYLYGTRGSLYIDDYTIVYQTNGQKEVQVVDLPPDSTPVANFVFTLQGKDKVRCGVVDGLRTTMVIHAAYQSTKKGQPVAVTSWV